MAALDARMARLRERPEPRAGGQPVPREELHRERHLREHRVPQEDAPPALPGELIRVRQARLAGRHWVGRRAVARQVAAPQAGRRGARSGPEVPRKGRFASAAPERVLRATVSGPRSVPVEFQERAVRLERVDRLAARRGPAVRPGARPELSAPVASAVRQAEPLASREPSEAVWLRVARGALLQVRAAAARPAESDAAAELRSAVVHLAARELEAALPRAARDAAEGRHGVVELQARARPSEVVPSVRPSEAAFHVLSHDPARLALARSEQAVSARAMPSLRTASPSGPSWQAARDEVLS
jgi:hypothetical protein